MTYLEKLRHPQWQRKRLEVLNLHNFKCQICFDDQSNLKVHHPYYVAGRTPWEYPLFVFQCLCQRCHESSHGPLEELGFNDWESVLDDIFATQSAYGQDFMEALDYFSCSNRIQRIEIFAALSGTMKDGTLNKFLGIKPAPL